MRTNIVHIGAGELTYINQIRQEICRDHSIQTAEKRLHWSRYPEALPMLEQTQLKRHADQYLGQLEHFRTNESRITDKMPTNFMHLGLIAVLFPGAMSPLSVGRASSVSAAQEAARSEQPICFLLQHDAGKNDVAPDDVHWVGTAGQVVRYVTAPDGAHHLIIQGQSRVRVLEFLDGWPFLVGRVATVDSSETMTPEIEARFLQLKERAAEAIQLLPNVNEEVAGAVHDPGLRVMGTGASPCRPDARRSRA